MTLLYVSIVVSWVLRLSRNTLYCGPGVMTSCQLWCQFYARITSVISILHFGAAWLLSVLPEVYHGFLGSFEQILSYRLDLKHEYLLPNLYLFTIHEHLISFSTIIYIIGTTSLRKLRINLSRDYILQFLCALECRYMCLILFLTMGAERKGPCSHVESLGFFFG